MTSCSKVNVCYALVFSNQPCVRTRILRITLLQVGFACLHLLIYMHYPITGQNNIMWCKDYDTEQL